MNKTQCLIPGYKSACLLCSNTKHETCHSFHFWPRNPHKLISVFISLVNSCWALVFHICINFSFSELSLYPLLTLPVFPPLERVSLVRATCLWHCLKIRIPIKPWKVESGGRMCVYLCGSGLCILEVHGRENQLKTSKLLFNILLMVIKHSGLLKW